MQLPRGSIAKHVRALLIMVGFAVIVVLSGCCAESSVAGPQERTVHITGVACSQQREGVGVDLGTGLVMTSGHVVDGLREAIMIRSADVEVRARIVHIDRRLDVAVLSVDSWLDGVVEIGHVEAGETGDVFLRDSDGVPDSIEFTVDRRIRAETLNVGRDATVERPSLQLTTTLQRGDSGAGLWSNEGQLVGVLWAITTSEAERAFAVQGDELSSVLDAAAVDPSGPSPC